jgi:hypothetical protein
MTSRAKFIHWFEPRRNRAWMLIRRRAFLRRPLPVQTPLDPELRRKRQTGGVVTGYLPPPEKSQSKEQQRD